MPYELSDLTIDLVLLARHLLKQGGRLVWFLPTVTEEYQDVDIPVCEGMELVANSEQRFGKWGRRVRTI
jgi:tRNA (guanine10-N2)-methyltransferase